MAQQTLQPGESVLGDEELLRKAKNAENGQIFTALFEDGWDSERVQQRYERPRCAELSLIVRLLWWTRHETEQVERLFSGSAFYRPELDSPPGYVRELTREASSLLGQDCYDPAYSPGGDR